MDMKKTPIVIPLHHEGGKLRNNTELRYCLRSIAAHFKGEHEIVIVGAALPSWAANMRHLPCEGGLKRALRVTAETFPDGFFWWYDDCCLLRDMGPEDVKVTPANQGWMDAKTSWAKQLRQIKDRLENEGHKAVDYSRPHGPYWFDRAMVEEGFADWPQMKGKFPWESWILSKRKWPRRIGAVKQYYGAFHNVPGHRAMFLNYNDVGNTDELRCWLKGRFPDRSPYEAQATEWEGVFFIHVPKTGGKAVLAAIGPRAVMESRTRHLPWSDPRVSAKWRDHGRLPIVACVRDPLERAISAYRWFRETEFPVEDQPHRVLREMFRCMTFSKFWETADVGYIATVVKHLRTQHSFLRGAPVGELMRHERLDQDFARVAAKIGVAPDLPRENVSTGARPAVSWAARNRIREFYADDYQHYYPEG